MSICNFGHSLYRAKMKSNQTIQFRDYTQADFDEVQSLWQQTGMGGQERGDDHSVIKRTIDNGGKLIIMELGNIIIGTSWLTTDSRRTFLHHFGIHPDYQGKGFANLLMDETMRHVKTIGYQVKLEVSKQNEKALNLYRKYKFIDFVDYELMMKRDISE